MDENGRKHQSRALASNSLIVGRGPQFGRRHLRYHRWMVDHSIWLAARSKHLTEVSQTVTDDRLK